MVWQASRFHRAADPVLAIASGAQDTRAMSTVFQHRVGLGRNISIGATHATIKLTDERRDEVFFKAAFAL